jgi:hypothetical protein
MFKNVMRTMTAGAVVLMSAGALSAASMKIDVPFSFRTPTAQMPAGEYMVSALPGNLAVPLYRLTHVKTGKANVVITPQMVTRTADAAGLPAQARFKCIGEYCALAEIYPVGEYGGRGVPLKVKPAHPDVAKGHTVVIAAR